MGQRFTNAGLVWLLKHLFNPPKPVTFTGDTTTGSTSIDNITSTAGLSAGMTITGTGIPANALIASVLVTSITISAAATATATAVSLTASPPGPAGGAMNLHLLTGAIPQTPLTVWGDLTEANYDGYAPQQMPFPSFAVSCPAGGFAVANYPCLQFIPADYAVPNTITGIAWTQPGAVGTEYQLVATEIFVEPMPLSTEGDLLQLIPALSFAVDTSAGPPSPVL